MRCLLAEKNPTITDDYLLLTSQLIFSGGIALSGRLLHIENNDHFCCAANTEKEVSFNAEMRFNN